MDQGDEWTRGTVLLISPDLKLKLSKYGSRDSRDLFTDNRAVIFQRPTQNAEVGDQKPEVLVTNDLCSVDPNDQPLTTNH
ncbi:hypothetical protein SSCH_70006 [Syntrophaceticus schinkii]|uniref:Uncharacterized protein n=1 Tax=Syntrophaceticus schinkii TaxID=499207 RepID=A0A0B7MP35_9FIRM|nr:hypothetical protein SSCH_70006 [Syntrophaceticus schinkii]